MRAHRSSPGCGRPCRRVRSLRRPRAKGARPCAHEDRPTRRFMTCSATPSARRASDEDSAKRSWGFEAKLHRNYVGAIERGEINPTLRILKLSKGLRVWPSELAELTELRWEQLRSGYDSAEPFEKPKAPGRRRRCAGIAPPRLRRATTSSPSLARGDRVRPIPRSTFASPARRACVRATCMCASSTTDLRPHDARASAEVSAAWTRARCTASSPPQTCSSTPARRRSRRSTGSSRNGQTS